MRHKRYIFLFILTVSVSLLVIGCVYNVISGKPWYANIMVQFFLNLPLCIGLGFIDFGVINLIYKRLKQRNNAVRILVVAVTNSPKHGFNRCKSAIYKFLSRDTKSARDKNGTKPRKNKVKNTSLEISLVEYLCFICKGTNLSLEKRGEIPISLIHNSFSYHCTPNVVIARILTSNSMTCEYRVLNFVLHSVGHFQKRELAIEPKICHPYCPILGLVNV